MLGNDVVDLGDPETRPETFRPRFDERVFDPTERRAIAHDPDPHARRWAFWAAKEAAYKLARQLDPRFVFAPSKLVVRFASGDHGTSDPSRLRGTLALPHALAPGLDTLELRGEIDAQRVHLMAIPRGGDWEAVAASIETLEPGRDPSAEVRRIAREGIARDLGVDVSRVEIGRRGRIPVASVDGASSGMSLSLSHHGRFLAWATRHRVDVHPGLASDREIGVA